MKKLILLTLFVVLLAACVQDGDRLIFRTADPSVNVSFKLLPPPEPSLMPTITPTLEPTPCDAIKGNIDAQGRKIYHTADSPNFNQVLINKPGEQYFCDTASAEAAGFVRAGN